MYETLGIWAGRFAFTLILVLGASAAPASADCPRVDTELAAARDALRSAEPAHDATQADFDRRLALLGAAYAHVEQAETIRSTTVGGCGDIQQVYGGMVERAWADLLLTYLKPSLEFYVNDPACKAISRLQTQAMLLDADEAMNHSLISWNPVDPRVIAMRDHVTHLVDSAAAVSKIPLPEPERAEDYARQYTSQLAALESNTTVDCTASITDPNVPKTIAERIFKS